MVNDFWGAAITVNPIMFVCKLTLCGAIFDLIDFERVITIGNF